MAEFEAAAAATGGISSHVHFQRECQTSEEDQIRSSDLGGAGGGGGGRSQTQIIQSSSGGGGGPAEGGSGTVEAARKPKGRPLGSKNKPKPPITIIRDNENAMKPHILEVAAGCDIAESVLDVVQRRQVGLCVTGGFGTVESVILRRLNVPASQLVQYRGQLQILSLSGMYLPVPSSYSSSSSSTGALTVSLAGSQGQVVGGTVMGEFIAAGPVTIIAASFTNPSYHRLRPEVDEENAVNTHLQADNQGAMAASTGHGNPPPVIYNNPINIQLPAHVLPWATGGRPPY